LGVAGAAVNPEAPFDGDPEDHWHDEPEQWSSWWWFCIIVLICVTVFGLVLAFTIGEGELR